MALLDSPKTYTELRRETGLSDRWLSKKLKKLEEEGSVGKTGSLYTLRRSEVIENDPVAMAYVKERATVRGKARLIAEQLTRRKEVVSVILFGSVARREETTDSDIDLIIVTDQESEDLNDEVYELMFRHDLPVEAINLTLEEFVLNVLRETTLIFGVLEEYEVLTDKAGIRGLLKHAEETIREKWTYDPEVGTWLQKKQTRT